MPRGVTLSHARNLLKSELGESLLQTSLDGELNQQIESIQLSLASTYDWPFLRDRWDVPYVPGQRFYTLPALDQAGQAFQVDFDRSHQAYTMFRDRWCPLEYGIDENEYNTLNPGVTRMGSPLLRWTFQGNNQFEVWPLSDVEQTITFSGFRTLTPLKNEGGAWNEAALLDLDALVIVYFCAASRLARLKQDDAGITLAKARERLSQLRATAPARPRRLTVGNHAEFDSDRPRLRVITAPGSGSGITGNPLLLDDGSMFLLD
jgi:hypothetical protein